MDHDRSSLFYWWPRIEGLPIPKPETVLIEVLGPEVPPFDRIRFWVRVLKGDEELPCGAIREAADRLGYPLFIRTDLCSAKHSFLDTCYVPDKRRLMPNLIRLIDENLSLNIVGLPFRGFVFRRYVEPAWRFRAFNGLPIAPERRCFIRDGELEAVYAYWPEEAILRPDREGWEDMLREMNSIGEEVEKFRRWCRLIGEVLPGYWSVDFMLTSTGEWILIDMAEGDKSWRPE